MNLEVLVKPAKAEGHPLEVFVLGVVYVIIAAVLAYFFLSEYASMGIVIFTVIACLPLVYAVIKKEASKELKYKSEKRLLQEHWHAVRIFLFLFMGFVAGYLLVFMVVSPFAASQLFEAQVDTITGINERTGAFFVGLSDFGMIVLHNIQVMILCFIFSVFFGSGALFILSWNASVMAAAIGGLIRSQLAELSGGAIGFFGIIFASFGKYATHGFLEIIAYFAVGLAGGILYHSVINKKLNKKVMKDIFMIISLSLFVIIIAGFVEVYITPLMFS